MLASMPVGSLLVATPPAAAPRPRGRRPRTDAERAAHRARLVAAAIDAIRRHGPDVAMSDIALAAGVSKPVLYDEFGDKLGVADAVSVHLAEQLEHDLIAQLARSGTFDVAMALDTLVGGLIELIDGEPELYGFIARSMRTGERGLLDHALVRIIRERTEALFGSLTPGATPRELRLVTDGWFGFVLAAVESWQRDRAVDRDDFVRLLSATLRAGSAGAADAAATPKR
jgi:AcrR family transcriptional regulator